MQAKEWLRTIDGQPYKFLVTTDRERIQADFVRKAFANPAMSWATPPSLDDTKTMLDNSCTLGLFIHPDDNSAARSTQMIGMARMITDYVTFAYLTDVYIEEEFRKFGLGKWMIQCCKEVVEGIPNLRWMLLLTISESASRLYERELGMVQLGHLETGLRTMGARRQHLEAAQSAQAPAASEQDKAPEGPDGLSSTQSR
jgi:hypothetical protein